MLGGFGKLVDHQGEINQTGPILFKAAQEQPRRCHALSGSWEEISKYQDQLETNLNFFGHSPGRRQISAIKEVVATRLTTNYSGKSGTI